VFNCFGNSYAGLLPGELRVGKEFSFRLRMIYKPFVSDEDIIREANRVIAEWKGR